MDSAGIVMRYGILPCASAAGSCIGTFVRILPASRNSISTAGAAETHASRYTGKNRRSTALGPFFTVKSVVGVTLPPWDWNGSLGASPLALGGWGRLRRGGQSAHP